MDIPFSDPFLDGWMAAQDPPLTGHVRAAARVGHAALHDLVDALDGELEVLCARRRAAVAGLRRLRPMLWPASLARHYRRPAEVDAVPIPPAPPNAVAVGGVELRGLCLGILRRHGACPLPELHGLIHRYGYVVDSSRPVQRLADALAYEVSQGRCVRVERGVYAAVGEASSHPQSPSMRTEPLPWSDPDPDRPQLDPVTIDDPERWSAGAWPWPEIPDARRGGERPRRPYPESHLDEEVHLARRRAAALVDHPVDPAPPAGADEPRSDDRPPEPPDSTEPPAPPNSPSSSSEDPSADPRPTDGASPPDWERFVDESFPMVRRWAQRRRDRQRRRRDGTPMGTGRWREHTGDDPPPDADADAADDEAEGRES